MTKADIPVFVDLALSKAAWEGDNETVRALLDCGADVHAWADAPLWEAALNGQTDTMSVLLDAGADQDIALIVAAENGHIELVRELLAKGANVRTHQGMPMLMAQLNGYADTVRVLENWRRKLNRARLKTRRRAARH